jgi:amino acid adenylation domain-containing protein/non-ribosomal peptide synthase protein (TIGR01720 family)
MTITTAQTPFLAGLYTTRHYVSHKAYWQAAAAKRDTPFALLGELGLDMLGDGEKLEVTHKLSKDAQSALSAISGGTALAEFVVIVSALSIALNSHVDDQHILIETPLLPAGPQQSDSPPFVPILLPEIAPESTLREHLSAINACISSSYKFQDYPRALVADHEALSSDIHVISLDLHGTIEAPSNTALTVIIEPTKQLRWYCPAGALPRNYLTALAAMTDQILQQLTDTKQSPNALSLIPKEWISREAEVTTGPERIFDKNDTITSLFAEQVAANGTRPACDDGGDILSYDDLAARAEGIRAALLAQGVAPGDVIAVLVDRNASWLSSVLGIMLAGAVYLPLDPNQPAARLAQIVAQANVRLCLDTTNQGAAPEGVSTLLDVARIDRKRFDPSLPGPKPSDTAYLLFTSGSTGVPRGVKVGHFGFTVMVRDQIVRYKITSADNYAQLAAATFDASLFEVFLALLAGAKVVLVDDKTVRSPQSLLDRFAATQVSVATITPRLLETMDRAPMPSLRVLITAGDVAPPALLHHYAATKTVVNAYGPTETSVCACSHIVNLTCDPLKVVPIGTPIANSRVQVCDKRGRPLPLGVPGEIVVSGQGVALGYVGREPNAPPFGIDAQTGHRRYATGDRGAYTDTGALVYLGRLDRQIKLRGYRIERSEIEAMLCTHQNVQQAHVPTPKHGSPLRVYAISSQNPAPSELLKFLASKLPEYMLPTSIIVIEALPLTSSGKVDESALPEPTINSALIEPRTKSQTITLEIWREILRKQDIGIQTDFFTAGGDSISAIQIASRLAAKGLRVSPPEILTAGTIEVLCEIAVASDAVQKTNQSPAVGPVPHLPAQAWFFEEFPHNQHHFNQSLALRHEGLVDPETVRATIAALCAHHDSLRLRVDGEALNIADRAVPDFVVIQGAPSKQDLDKLQAGHCLTNGSLLRAVLAQQERDAILYLSIHHLAIDWVSWMILIADFTTAFEAIDAGKPVDLPLRTASVRDWAAEVVLDQNKFSADAEHWTALAKAPFRAIAKSSGCQGDRVLEFCEIEPAVAKQILGNANTAFGTRPQELLLTGLLMALIQQFGSGFTPVLIEGHGRDPILSTQDISRTVGWFTSVYPVGFDTLPVDMGARIKLVKEALRTVPNQGASYLPLAYGINSDTNLRHPAPQVTFNYLGGGDASLQTSRWSQSDLSTGTDVHPMMSRVSPLDCSAVGVGDTLAITLGGTPDGIAPDKLKTLSQHLRQALSDISAYCVNCNGPELTASDVALSGLDQSELDALFED